MALDENVAVISVDEALLALGLGENDHNRVERLINYASARVERYCHTRFRKRSLVLTLSGPDFEMLDLGSPVVSLSNGGVGSVKVGGVALLTTEYTLLKERGQIYKSGGWSGGEDPISGAGGLLNVEVSGDFGWDPVPFDVQEAVLIIIRGKVSRPGGEGLQSERIGEYSYSRFAPGGAGSAVPNDIPEEARALLDPYVRYPV